MKRNGMEYRTGLVQLGEVSREEERGGEEEEEEEGKGCSISSRLAQCPGCDLLPETVSRIVYEADPNSERRRLPILNKR